MFIEHTHARVREAMSRPCIASVARQSSSRTRTTVFAPIQDADRRRIDWMAAAQAGDRIAYDMLLRDCIPLIRRVARRRGVRPDLVDDVVQETLLTIHRARRIYDPNRSFTAWVRMIAQRRAVDGLRRAGRSAREVYAPLDYENHPDVTEDPEQAVLERDRVAELGTAIGELPAGQRGAIEHFLYRDRSLACAGTAAGRTTGSLRTSLHRAIKALRANLPA